MGTSNYESFLIEWQKKLRLMDWNIALNVCTKREISDSMATAEVTISNHTKEAIIDLLNEKDFNVGDYGGFHSLIGENRCKFDILHELAEIRLQAWEPQNDSELLQKEQACNMFAWALLHATNHN